MSWVPQSSQPWVTPTSCSLNLCANLGISLTRPEVTLLSLASVTKACQHYWSLALIPSELKLGPFPGQCQGDWTRSPPFWYQPSHWGASTALVPLPGLQPLGAEEGTRTRPQRLRLGGLLPFFGSCP